MKEERLVKRRVVPVVVLTVLTLLFTFLMGIRNTMPLDEVVVPVSYTHLTLPTN